MNCQSVRSSGVTEAPFNTSLTSPSGIQEQPLSSASTQPHTDMCLCSRQMYKKAGIQLPRVTLLIKLSASTVWRWAVQERGGKQQIPLILQRKCKSITNVGLSVHDKRWTMFKSMYLLLIMSNVVHTGCLLW